MSPPVATDPIALQLFAAQQDSPMLFALFDEGDLLRYANDAFRRGYGIDPDEQLPWAALLARNHQRGVGALIETTDFPRWLAVVQSRRGKLPFRAFEADLCDGRWLWMTETLRTDGWMLCIASDISELKHSERMLRHAKDVAVKAAQTDVLTGIGNRAFIMAQLALRIELLRTQQQPCAVALLDLDHFKRVNDTYGHQTGDAVLTHFTQKVNETLRQDDSFGRIGGEEFMVLCPNTSDEGINQRMNRILSTLRESRPLAEFPQFHYTCSVGVGQLQPQDTVSSICRRVDEALYGAKAAGRDRVVWA
jgi:diguanylate cyclase (GGDEF)-like protein